MILSKKQIAKFKKKVKIKKMKNKENMETFYQMN